MRFLILIMLAACGPKQLVVVWASGTTSAGERIEIESSGQARYTRANNGVIDKNEPLALTKDQLGELDDLLRSHHACALADDPAYTPIAGEGKTTLELAFPDQRCKVALWDFTWQRGDAKEIAETMRSMRPLRSVRPR